MGFDWRKQLAEGLVIPAHPLALTSARKLDERRQRALTRYYLDSGAGGLAVGVHTTQFAIRAPESDLFKPVLHLAIDSTRNTPTVMVAGICGDTEQAVAEASFAADLGYHCGLVNLGPLGGASNPELIEHIRAVAEVLPVFGFYLQPAAGGRVLPLEFWRNLMSIESLVAIKIAPFDRYRTLDVLRAVAEAGRASDIALYTGNDDHILLDLLTPTVIAGQELRFCGGLLGHWAVWTSCATELLRRVQGLVRSHAAIPVEMLVLAQQITDANSALFDARNSFRGSIAGIHEVLRQQGLMSGRWCLDPEEDLSPGQLEEIERVCRAYPHLRDDEFVRENLDRWMRP
ncbi:MAG: dihydrodipicolinate synthase family protein [Bryobacteraceae bacterium]